VVQKQGAGHYATPASAPPGDRVWAHENAQPHGARLQVLAGYVGWIDPGGIWDSLVAWERLPTYLFLPISGIHQPPMLRKPITARLDLSSFSANM